ncbi:MAG: hypothetical protein E6I03_09680 [Chloroflexi bacterium]|nr:MAG: hypothetical protein E6I03_09680 [Chloroflexota bacterium]
MTLLCVALVALVLAGFAITVNFLASTRIYASLDDGLEAQANSIIASLPAGRLDESLIESSRPALEAEEAAGLLFQIRDSSGQVLYSSFRGSQDVLPPGGSLDQQAVYERKVAQQQLRLLHMPIDSASRGGSIEVGRPTKETDEALTEIRLQRPYRTDRADARCAQPVLGRGVPRASASIDDIANQPLYPPRPRSTRRRPRGLS